MYAIYLLVERLHRQHLLKNNIFAKKNIFKTRHFILKLTEVDECPELHQSYPPHQGTQFLI